MEVLIKVNNQTTGRDKIARFIQYLSRFLWHRLQKNNNSRFLWHGHGLETNSNSVNNFKNLEFQLSTFRKLLRFGRFFESLYATLPLFQHEDPTIRYSVILSKIANSLFLLADHILWLGRADVCTVDTVKWSKLSNKYWLYSIVMNLVRDFYEISKLVQVQKLDIFIDSTGNVKSQRDIIRSLSQFCRVLLADEALVIDTVKNVCDFFIPLSALGHVKLSAGTIGLLGCVSSLAGLLVVMKPYRKLTPS